MKHVKVYLLMTFFCIAGERYTDIGHHRFHHATVGGPRRKYRDVAMEIFLALIQLVNKTSILTTAISFGRIRRRTN